MTSLLGLTLALAFLTPEATLVIRSQPGAEVLWDGVSIGKVANNGSMQITGIPLGDYRITVRKAGFKQLQHNVRIEEGQQRLSARLASIEGQSQENPAQPAQDGLIPGQAAPADPVPTDGSEGQTGPLPGEEGDEPAVMIAAPEERASQLAGSFASSTTPWFAYTLLVILFLSLGILLSRRLVSMSSELPPIPRESGMAGQPLAAGGREFQSPPVFSESGQAPFLDQLKEREAQVESGVEIIPPEEGRIIDITPESVREAEES